MPTQPHIGAPDMYDLGQALCSMFTYTTEEHQPTSFLTMQEDPQRYYDRCPVCGHDGVPGGNFTLRHHYKNIGIRLPYLAAHGLAAHGSYQQGLVELDRLRELLNIDERKLGSRVVGIVSGAAPDPRVIIGHQSARATHNCQQCNDEVNKGTIRLAVGGLDVEVKYLELHTLFKHGDVRWGDSAGESGTIDIKSITQLLQTGEDLVELGEQLTAILAWLGGEVTPPAWLLVDEQPMRGT